MHCINVSVHSKETLSFMMLTTISAQLSILHETVCMSDGILITVYTVTMCNVKA